MSSIIDLGICIDNVDPKGIGRIRCVRYSDRISEKQKALDFVPWSDKDPFVASPFLPQNINFIPEKEQAVKIINYNPDKEHVNQEYIAGPFTTSHDFNSQTFSQQIEHTSYGVVLKESPDIIDKNDNYIDNKTIGAFAKKGDWALYGKFGSDVLFTENGLQLRGGKLLSKDAASPINREKMVKFPIMGKKSSTLYLKKFPKKMVLEKKETTTSTTEIKDLNVIIEYEIDNLNVSSGKTINFYVYKVISTLGLTTKTNYFTESTPLPTSALKLINTDNSTSTPTHTIVLDSEFVNDVHHEIRDFLYTLHEENLFKINPLYTKEDLHPFFFRPSSNFISLSGSTQDEKDYKNNLISNVKVFSVGPKSGLVFSKLNIYPQTKSKKVKKESLKILKSSPEQTFSALKSDKIYFLSTDTNESDKSVNFYDLDRYDLTQEDYVRKIDPNTYSTVRGENLIKLIKSIVTVLFNHQHNLTKPMVKIGYNEYDELVELLKSMEDDILNGSIRIN